MSGWCSRPPLTLEYLRESFDLSSPNRFDELIRRFRELGHGRDRLVFLGPDDDHVIKLDYPNPEYAGFEENATNNDEFITYRALKAHPIASRMIPDVDLVTIESSCSPGQCFRVIVMNRAQVFDDLTRSSQEAYKVARELLLQVFCDVSDRNIGLVDGRLVMIDLACENAERIVRNIDRMKSRGSLIPGKQYLMELMSQVAPELCDVVA